MPQERYEFKVKNIDGSIDESWVDIRWMVIEGSIPNDDEIHFEEVWKITMERVK
ncbi:MAG: hypothetical protein PHI12_12960 [Dehalococcoidales bacterium]|nr:hypothetical protein [Dehalococcoidales bacterium]